jgi:hypothetical protein
MHAVHGYGSVYPSGAQLTNKCGSVFFAKQQIDKNEREDMLSNLLVGGFHAGHGLDFVAESFQLLLDARTPLRIVVDEEDRFHGLSMPAEIGMPERQLLICFMNTIVVIE